MVKNYHQSLIRVGSGMNNNVWFALLKLVTDVVHFKNVLVVMMDSNWNQLLLDQLKDIVCHAEMMLLLHAASSPSIHQIAKGTKLLDIAVIEFMLLDVKFNNKL